MDLNFDIPEAFEYLYKPMRFKCAYGGRGSGKSWAIAQLIIVKMLEKPTRVLCCRETMKSLKESSWKLLSDTVERLKVSHLFTITDRTIICKHNGSNVIFEGLYNNVQRIKSLEGINLCVVSEAQDIKQENWDLLTPTIRSENSEIICEFNPQYLDDATYRKFVTNTPPNCISRLVNFNDNPFFPKVLEVERLSDLNSDPGKDGKGGDFYKNKWLGEPKLVGGRIWTAFDTKIHVREFPWEMLRNKANCFCTVDPHQHRYPAIIWIARFPKNDRGRPEDFVNYIYNEWPTRSLLGGSYADMNKKVQYTGTMKELVQQIEFFDKTGEYGLKIYKRVMDSRFGKGTGSWSWSSSTDGIVAEFAREGLNFSLPRETIIDSQRNVIINDMQYNKNMTISEFNMPSLYVAPWCTNVIESLSNHRLLKDSETEDEKYKDFSDALRIGYAGINDHRYIDPITNKRTTVNTANSPDRLIYNVYTGQMGRGGNKLNYSVGGGDNWMAN